MTGSAIAMMIAICTLVWGGFLAFVGVIWRIEKRKAAQGIRKPPHTD